MSCMYLAHHELESVKIIIIIIISAASSEKVVHYNVAFNMMASTLPVLAVMDVRSIGSEQVANM